MGEAVQAPGFGSFPTVTPGTPILEVRSGGSSRYFPLTAPIHRLGRGPDNDIIVDSPIVSRSHLVLERVDDDYRMRDVSRNGVWLGDQRVGELTLSGRTELWIGTQADQRVTLVYQTIPSTPVATEPSPAVSLDGRSRLLIGRDPASDLPLNDPVCSRRQALLEASNGRWTIRDLGSSNGTFVDGKMIQQAVLEPGSIIQVGNTRFAFDGSRLQQRAGQGLRIDARDLVKVGDQNRALLEGISFSILPGEFVALLGGSGAGKSTLLGALTGLRPATRGDLRYDGTLFYQHRGAFRHSIGYVPQDDIIHRELTVERALWYAGRLRMPTDTSGAEIRQQISSVLHDVGMSAQLKSPIGRLSGGQRKRTSIAVELLTRPPLLMLDEPTSGLDPGLDRQMMILLSRLAVEGQTVIVVTHAVANIDLCDKVIFLSRGGRLAFFGSPTELREYFGNEDFGEIYRTIDSEEDIASWPSRFQSSPEYARHVAGRLAEAPTAPRAEAAAKQPTRARRQPAWRQFLVLAQRYWDTIRGDLGYAALLLGQAPAVALMLLTVLGGDILVDPAQIGTAYTFLFVLSAAAVWFGLINAVREIVKETAIHQREHNIGVGTGPYVASKLVVLSLLAVAQIALLVAILAVRIEMPSEGLLLPFGVLEIYLTLLLTSWVGIALGLLLSAVTTNPNRAMSLTPWVLIGQIIYSGVVFELSGAARVVSWATATLWSIEDLAATVRLPIDAYGNPLDPPVQEVGYLVTRWLILLGIGVVCLVVIVVSLRIRDREGPFLSRLGRSLLP